MTAIHEGVAFGVTTNKTANLQAEQSLAEAQERHQQICRELGKLAPAGEVVRDFRVEGWNRICSPVKGNIIVVTSTSAEGDDLGERVVFPTNAREAVDITIFDDLNVMGEQWRTERQQSKPNIHFGDTSRNL